MPKGTLLLLDGHAMAYRAFHAIQGLTNRAGQPTNAIYGFVKMLKQLEAQWQPTHLIAVFDGGLPAERMALLETYKAQRKPMPDELRSQMALLNEYLAAASIPVICMDGEEADDVLATLAVRARDHVEKVIIATHDKDMFQLVDDRIRIASTTKGGEQMGPAEVETKTGVPPSMIVDWLALMGDTADNIPGVNGVGEKTAAKLLHQFGSITAMYERLHEVEREKLRAALTEGRAAAERNIKMMRLKPDLNLPMEWTAGERRRPDFTTLIALLERLDLHTFTREARDAASRLF